MNSVTSPMVSCTMDCTRTKSPSSSDNNTMYVTMKPWADTYSPIFPASWANVLPSTITAMICSASPLLVLTSYMTLSESTFSAMSMVESTSPLFRDSYMS